MAMGKMRKGKKKEKEEDEIKTEYGEYKSAQNCETVLNKMEECR